MNYAQLPPFEELVELAKKNQPAFDAFKQDMCEQTIRDSSEGMRSRLRAQQSHIDRVLKRCKNPYHANVVLMRELSEQVSKFWDVLEWDMEENIPSADIIPFKPRNQNH